MLTRSRIIRSSLRRADRSLLPLACLAIVLAACAPVSAHAENCAWLNAATAGGILGVESSVKIEPITEHLTPDQVSARQVSGARPDAICTFLPQKTDSGAELQITVHTMVNIPAEYEHFAAACSKDAISLRAIGNQAVECSERGESHSRVEKVIGRTRDRAFVLVWTIPGPEDGPNAMTQDAIREKMRNLAEQVAGSLF
jgi:hypothetical protein